ncbi:RHS repeat-associated core domain-containing protein [Chitinimonas sp. JJ19]|uniref:RHS repeat-associated core domain-containing protein n=1 Tax=Chitinimonas sp. JJ19 TaxID=3109352 RepID=UPI0030015F5D
MPTAYVDLVRSLRARLSIAGIILMVIYSSAWANQAPTVGLVSPLDTSYYNYSSGNRNVALSARATDPEGKIGSVKFIIKPGQSAAVEEVAATAPATGNNWTANWSFRDAGGAVTVQAVVTDDKGLSASSAIHTIYGNPPPAVTLTINPTTYTVAEGKTATVTVKATAVDSGVTLGYYNHVGRMELFVNGSQVEAKSNPASGSNNMTTTFTPLQLAAGVWSIEVRAKDILGGVGIATQTVKVNGPQPPESKLLSPKEGDLIQLDALSAVKIEVEASDDVAIKKVEFYAVNRVTGESKTINTQNVSGTSKIVTANWAKSTMGTGGHYEVYARVYDDRNVYTDSAKARIYLNLAPTASFTASPSGTLQTGANGKASITLTATATDPSPLAGPDAQFNPGQVARLEFLANDTVIATSDGAAKRDMRLDYTWTPLPGTYVVKVRATDLMYGVYVSGSQTITVKGNLFPTVQLSQPTTDIFRQLEDSAARNVRFEATASDTDGAVSLVSFVLQPVAGGNAITVDGTKVGNLWRADWVIPAEGGHYKLSARAQDNQGGIGDSAAITLTGNPLPVVELDSLNSQTVYGAGNGATVNVLFKVKANDAGIVTGTLNQIGRIAILMDGVEVNAKDINSPTADYSVTLPIPLGIHTLQAVAVDGGAGLGRSPIKTVKVVAGAGVPTIQLVAPQMGQEYFGPPAAITFEAKIDGYLAQMTHVDVSVGTNDVDNNFWASNPVVGQATHQGGGRYTYTWAAPPLGTYYVQFLARGNNGTTFPWLSKAQTFFRVKAGLGVQLLQPLPNAQGFNPLTQGQAVILKAKLLDGAGQVERLVFELGTPNAQNVYQYTAIADGVTDANGIYSHSWIPTTLGSYDLRARLYYRINGESHTQSANTTIQVQQRPVGPITGQVDGLYRDGGKLLLRGWACDTGTDTPVAVHVAKQAELGQAGSELIGSATANQADNDNGAINAQCQSGTSAHKFEVDITAGNTGGKAPLYLYGLPTTEGRQPTKLSCTAGACQLPGALEVGFTTPNDNARMNAGTNGASLFFRAKVSGATAAIDKVEFDFEGEMLLGVQESNDSTAYAVTKPGVAARSNAYIVTAKVTSDGVVVNAAARKVYVDAGQGGSSISLTSPAAGAQFNQGMAISLQARIGAGTSIDTVRFFGGNDSGTQLGKVTSFTVDANGNMLASLNWTDAALGSHKIIAKAYTNGAEVTASNGTAITVMVPGTVPNDGTPVAIAPAVGAELDKYLNNADAGTLPGELGSNDGAVIYNLPIAVPPGTAGVAPTLSLNYSSNGANGIAGLGWSLSGFSSIHRCETTIAQDGVAGRITFSTSDRLCLDGQRLIRVNGSDTRESDAATKDAAYWATDAEYRTEIESFQRITRYSANGRLGFKVETKAGQTLYYGVDGLNGQAASYVLAQGRQDGAAVSWAVDRREDTMGNRLVFEYELDATRGEHHPKQIRYGSNANTSESADLAVRFAYEARPDVQNGYFGGSKSDQTQRLKTITTAIGTESNGIGGTVASIYTLDYSQSASTGRSLLKTAEQCAPGRTPTEATVCLPKTTFTWGQPAAELRFTLAKEIPELVTPPVQGLKLWGLYGPDQGYFEGGTKPNKILFESNEVCTPGFCDPNYPVLPEEMSTTKYLTGKYRMLLSDGRTVEGMLPLAGVTTPEAIGSISVGTINGDARDGLWLMSPYLAAVAGGPTRAMPIIGYCTAKDDVTDGVVFECQRIQTHLQLAETTAVGLSHFDQLSFGKPSLVVSPAGGLSQACVWMAGQLRCQPHKQVVDLPLPADSPLGSVEATGRYDSFAALSFSRGEISDLFSVTYRHTSATSEHLGYVRICLNKANWECQVLMGHRHKEMNTLGEYTGSSTVGDLSGDGLADFAFYDGDKTTYVCLNTETSADCFAAGEGWGHGNRAAGGNTSIAGSIGDFEGSGQASLLIAHRLAVNNQNDTSELRLCRLSDRTLACRPVAGGVPSLPGHKPASLYADPESAVPSIILRAISAGGTWPTTSKVYTLATVPGLDRIVSVTNGLGQADSINYARADDAETYQRLVEDENRRKVWPAYPQQIGQPGVMVKTIERDNGVAGTRTTQFRYEQVLRDAVGRKNLGFAKQSVKDLQSNITTQSTYEQTWPKVGMVKQTVTTAGNGTVLSHVISNPAVRELKHANQDSTWFVHVNNTVTIKRDLCDDPNGCDLGSTTQSFQFDDWGNATRQESVIKAADNKAYTTLTVNTYKSANAGDAPWRFGLMDTTAVTNTLPDGRSLTRSKAFTYDSYGLLKTDTVEPDDAKLKLVTTLDRSGNAFGLVNIKTLSWTNPLTGAAESRASETTRYDNRGRFAESVGNALGHTEIRAVDARNGILTSLTGSNGLTTTWQVDGLGRKQKEIRADGTETRIYSKVCGVGCPSDLGAKLVSWTDSFKGTDRIGVPTLAFSDHEGRVLRTQGWSFDGTVVHTDSRYDTLGRIWEVDQPHFVGTGAILASRKSYDALDRVKVVTTLDEQGREKTATTSYAGLIVTDTNAKGHTRIAQRNVLGQLVQSTDAKQGVTAYGRDPFGNLDMVTDPVGNVVKIAYNRLGHKTDLHDPDLGWVHYDVDPIGQVLQQISPKQRKAALGKPVAEQALHYTRFQFDTLGRMTARLEPDLTSRWIYDQPEGTPAGSGDNLACTARKSCGLLVEAYTFTEQGKDYSRSHGYDNLGRPNRTEALLGSTRYSRETQYDAWGRAAVSRQQRGSQSAKQYDQRYNAYGYLARVERGNTVLWQAEKQDAVNRVLEASLGGALTQLQTYNRYTGLPDDATLKNSQNQTLLFEDYQYDVLGNMSQRSQQWLDHAGFSELFGYDDLNRLTSAHVAGKVQQTYQYNAVGNLLNKTGVGTGDYVYPGKTTDPQQAITRPHAVQSIPGYGSFSYDDNGNLDRVTKANGQGSRVLTWTSFDMPQQLSKGSVWSKFVYGPEHQRVRQERSDGSVVWYAEGMEVETRGNTTKVKTYWPASLGLEVDQYEGNQAQGETKQHWTHRDRLGSVIAITDAQGKLTEKFAYDAWGKRRSLDGSNTPEELESALEGVVDNKGFTGHEMLEELDLVHMNGRIYEPLVARFMSADPLIQDPEHSQSYNRYSYVWNNPTNLTDPTGFAGVGSEKQKITPAPKKQEKPCEGEGCSIKGAKAVVVKVNGNGTVTVKAIGQNGKIFASATMSRANNASLSANNTASTLTEENLLAIDQSKSPYKQESTGEKLLNQYSSVSIPQCTSEACTKMTKHIAIASRIGGVSADFTREDYKEIITAGIQKVGVSAEVAVGYGPGFVGKISISTSGVQRYFGTGRVVGMEVSAALKGDFGDTDGITTEAGVSVAGTSFSASYSERGGLAGSAALGLGMGAAVTSTVGYTTNTEWKDLLK